ncbi:hypothetical protein UlMin_043186 [Ulmus minor]
MGILKSEDQTKTELEEFRRMLVASAGIHFRKDQRDLNRTQFPATKAVAVDDLDFERLVCVTSGLSFLGIAIVNKLLASGYSVRIIVDNPEDTEKMREMGSSYRNISVVTAKLTDLQSLSQAFQGCRGVFHTSAFIDPAGLSGYTRNMVELEARASECVMEACSRTPSVKKCVFTSSLLACVRPDTTDHHHHQNPPLINHDCWSDEALCKDEKLWLALGKLRAEKAAWRVAEESGLKMATICPALITGPDFCSRNSTATIAYLKGAQEMYECGVLATVDVNRLAEAHVCVFEELNKTASGRYICFDRIIDSVEEAEELARQTNICKTRICGNGATSTSSSRNVRPRFQLSNRKLSNLMSTTTPRRCYNESLERYDY